MDGQIYDLFDDLHQRNWYRQEPKPVIAANNLVVPLDLDKLIQGFHCLHTKS